MRYKKLFNERVKTMTEEEIMTEIKDAYQYHSQKEDTYPSWLINRVDELKEQNKRYRELLEKLKHYTDSRLIKINTRYRELVEDITKELEESE